jgi:hypothetical protein
LFIAVDFFIFCMEWLWSIIYFVFELTLP